ncbi:MAG TPA: DNA-processing protein DprA [Chryseolinea sp.]|nr:DNA-processing protein DprA [Chryseolinea sp.]
MDQNRLALLALHFIPGIGDHMIRQLISYCGSAEKVFKTPKGKLLNIPGIGEVTAKVIQHGNPFHSAEKEIRKAERADVQLIFFTDKHYPSRLKQIEDAPSLLYAKGKIDFEAAKTVGIIGTRRSTEYGKQCTAELIAGLVPHQALIVSGLAYGIDIQAHKQAIMNKLPTVGVMGSGIDVIYPASHSDVVRTMLPHGGIITENPFSTKPDAHNFPARNRIIAGLSDAIVVVEAAERGGALITVDIANSYNKEVFAFPGDIGRSFSAGCNNLIKSNRAHLITSVKDLEFMMNWDLQNPKVKKEETFSLDAYNPDEQVILKLLLDNNKQLHLDELSWRSTIPVSRLASLLLALEFKNVVLSLPGKIYKLKGI